MNLRDYYSEEQVELLLGTVVACRGIVRLNGKKFYPRVRINELVWLDKKPSEIFKTNSKLISMPSYDLDTGEWVSFADASEMIPYSVDMILETADTHDLLKPVRTRRVYGITFYNKQDLVTLLGERSDSKYYNISLVELNEYNGSMPVVPSDPNIIDSYYSPREALLVLNTVHRRRLSKFKNTFTFGTSKFIYILDLHDVIEDFKNRAAYVLNNRLYKNEKWSDWLAMGDLIVDNKYSRSLAHKLIKEHKVGALDLGGIMAYNKKDWMEIGK